jgi:hypothetical protein
VRSPRSPPAASGWTLCTSLVRWEKGKVRTEGRRPEPPKGGRLKRKFFVRNAKTDENEPAPLPRAPPTPNRRRLQAPKQEQLPKWEICFVAANAGCWRWLVHLCAQPALVVCRGRSCVPPLLCIRSVSMKACMCAENGISGSLEGLGSVGGGSAAARLHKGPRSALPSVACSSTRVAAATPHA